MSVSHGFLFAKNRKEREMEIIQKRLDELKPYEKNPRRNAEAVEFVANSIKEFGFKVPIVVDKNNVIVAGHTRYLASKELGLETVPCIVADDLTDKQIKAFRIADNKTADKALWDFNLLGDELKGLLDDFNMVDFGFGDFEIQALTNDFEPNGYDKEVEEEFGSYGENFLAEKRVLINYTDETEEDLKKLLGVDGELKVRYEIEEILALQEGKK